MNAKPHATLLRSAALIALAALGAERARAQSFNIDLGATAGTNPSGAYPAGAPQPGFWNWVNPGAAGVPQGLIQVTGAATPATLTVAGGGGNFSFNNAGTAGDHEKLMDDVHDVGIVGSVASYSFAGLLPGGYWIYTYAWGPDNPAFRTRVHVPGAEDPDQNVGGAWPGGQVYQQTFALHFVVYAGGPPLVVTAETTAGSGSVNGFQLVFGGSSSCDGELQSYCTAKINSAGCTPMLSTAFGPPSMTPGVPFKIQASNILCGMPGILIYSRTGPAALPLGGGTLCLAAPIVRTPAQLAGCAGGPPCGGSYSFEFNLHMQAAGPGVFSPGDPVWAQFWNRDSGFASPNNMGFTQALRFTVCF
jgi:hypothetical protein